ncbi:MAG: hypothetical protein ACYSTJ_01625 [Planctomycetota bacterium]|jgi:hypothetical protein
MNIDKVQMKWVGSNERRERAEGIDSIAHKEFREDMEKGNEDDKLRSSVS